MTELVHVLEQQLAWRKRSRSVCYHYPIKAIAVINYDCYHIIIIATAIPREHFYSLYICSFTFHLYASTDGTENKYKNACVYL